VSHHEVELAVAGLVDLVDGADVRMIQGRRSLGLVKESLLRRVVAGQVRRQELDGDLTPQARVSGRIDDAHAAVPEFGEDVVGAESGAWRHIDGHR
jgi:hypothetical protein